MTPTSDRAGQQDRIHNSAAPERVCPYCWTPPCFDKHDPMLDCPTCLPPGGYGVAHEACQAAVYQYVKEAEGV